MQSCPNYPRKRQATKHSNSTVCNHQPSERYQSVCFNYIVLYHKPPDSGEDQYTANPCGVEDVNSTVCNPTSAHDFLAQMSKLPLDIRGIEICVTSSPHRVSWRKTGCRRPRLPRSRPRSSRHLPRSLLPATRRPGGRPPHRSLLDLHPSLLTSHPSPLTHHPEIRNPKSESEIRNTKHETRHPKLQPET